MRKFVLIFLFIIILVGIIFSVFIEPNALEVKKYKIEDKNLKGLKIVFAADLHIKPKQQKRLQQIVSTINAQEPDLILFGGDFVSGHNTWQSMPPEVIAKDLKNCRSKYGIYTVLGNHDNWQNAIKIRQELKSIGIYVLDNENIIVKINNKTVYIAGVEDLVTGFPDINKALQRTKPPTILLTHSPDIYPSVPKNVTLTLAGHTHGGQVRVPFVGAVSVPSQYGNRYAQGLINENNKKMIVTKGIGTSVLPIRFHCKPEIVVIEFI